MQGVAEKNDASLVEAEAGRDDWFKWALGKIWIVAKGLATDVVERVVI
jgi:hypothetical protein